MDTREGEGYNLHGSRRQQTGNNLIYNHLWDRCNYFFYAFLFGCSKEGVMCQVLSNSVAVSCILVGSSRFKLALSTRLWSVGDAKLSLLVAVTSMRVVPISSSISARKANKHIYRNVDKLTDISLLQMYLITDLVCVWVTRNAKVMFEVILHTII